MEDASFVGAEVLWRATIFIYVGLDVNMLYDVLRY